MAFSFVLNQNSAQVGTVAEDVMYKVITAFIAGWGAGAIRASGDGSAAFSMSGSVFTQGVNGSGIAGNIGNPNAWFVVAPPDGSYYLCYQRNASTGIRMGCAFSLNPFTGGAPSATVRPTSVGEVVIRTPANGGSLFLGSTSPSYIGSIMHCVFGGADEEYAFAMINHPAGIGWSAASPPTALVGGLFVDVCERSFVNVNQPSRHIVCPFVALSSFWESGGGGVIFDVLGSLTTPHSTNDRPLTWHTDSSEPMVSCGLITPTGALENAFDYRFGWDGTRRVQMMQGVWATKDSSTGKGVPLIRGRSRLFKVATAPSQQVVTEGRIGPMSFSTDLQHWFLGSRGAVALPWDGSTDSVIAV